MKVTIKPTIVTAPSQSQVFYRALFLDAHKRDVLTSIAHSSLESLNNYMGNTSLTVIATIKFEEE